ncbi:hypothetical protein B296_00005508 [Ensete ventricosum]|uniref:Transposase (putative) gypsy type domain-containing protein n=1 Tax=Ensete ventricosum TaxID=4639 RepID=A0A426ZB37_ENSVE|nr:hypothetical protein B296_00005508 [Ensete ventricosum]
MKADHDLDTAVTDGSLAVIRGQYSIPVEYGLHVLLPGQRPYSSDALGMCITVDALEAGLRFPLHLLIEECLRWWRISPSQVAPNSWRYLVVFLGERRGARIIPTRDLFMAYFRLCKSRGGYYLTARVSFRVSEAPSNNKGWKSRYLFVSDQMNLDDLRRMPKMSNGKAPSTRAAAPAREVGISPTREAPKASSKRPIDAPTEQANDPARRHKKVKVLMRRHKSQHGEGESRSHSKGMEPAASEEEPDTPTESDEGDTSPIYHRPRSMKDIFKTKVHKDEALQRLEASKKKLNEVRSNLAEIQRLLKEALVRARKMDDELLQAVKALENARAELLKMIGRVTYEYGYRVALARFHALSLAPI